MKNIWIAGAVAALSLAVLSTPRATAQCPGQCQRGGAVTFSTGVTLGLHWTPRTGHWVSDCPPPCYGYAPYGCPPPYAYAARPPAPPAPPANPAAPPAPPAKPSEVQNISYNYPAYYDPNYGYNYGVPYYQDPGYWYGYGYGYGR